MTASIRAWTERPFGPAAAIATRSFKQGKAGSLQFAKGPQGLDFEHPVDIGTAWAEQPCNSCHTGGPQ